MTDNVNKVEALGWIVLKHVSDKVFETIVEEIWTFRFFVVLPEQIGTICNQELVVSISWVCLVKWWVTNIQNEEDDTKGEQVCLIALVGLIHDKFRRHVSDRSKACV